MAALLLPAGSPAQDALPLHVLQIAQLKRNVRAGTERLSNYTCLETIQRSRRKSSRQTFQYEDTLRLEVAVVKGRELYSWPGANQFEERDLIEMVGGGTIGSGQFSSELRAVLVSDVGTITYHGEEELHGRRALRWDYRIPLNLSGWTVHFGERSGLVSHRGSFWADAETLELLRLESNAEDIPPGLPVSAVKSTLDYARVRLGGNDLLLPQRAELFLADIAGGESRNVAEFSHCRQYSSQATLRFDEPVFEEKPAAAVAEMALPAGLRVVARLVRAIESRTAAVGDPVTAVLDNAIAQKGKTLAPAGAVLRGRLRRLERYANPRPHFVVGVEFTDLEFPGHHARFYGEMDEFSSGASALLMRSTMSSRQVGGTTTQVHESATETYRTLPIPGVSTFYLEGKEFRLPEGYRLVWRTVELKKR